MAAIRQTVAQTLEEIISWRPVLEPVLKTFAPVLAARDALAAELKEDIRNSGPGLPAFNPEYLRQGVSLLPGNGLKGTACLLRASAAKLLPLLTTIHSLAPHVAKLEAVFLGPAPDDADATRDDREILAEAVLADDQKQLAAIAQEAELDAAMLQFVAIFVLSGALRALIAASVDAESQGPWNQDDLWQQGYCPVCGTLPSIGWLDKPAVDEKNAYLAGGGGKKHLYCGLCGADWRWRRGACPKCGAEGSGTIEILRESGIAHGERLDWCTSCKSYCPTVDLREREFVPNLDAAALGMMHLDMVAARKDLTPLRVSFWNNY